MSGVVPEGMMVEVTMAYLVTTQDDKNRNPRGLRDELPHVKVHRGVADLSSLPSEDDHKYWRKIIAKVCRTVMPQISVHLNFQQYEATFPSEYRDLYVMLLRMTGALEISSSLVDPTHDRLGPFAVLLPRQCATCLSTEHTYGNCPVKLHLKYSSYLTLDQAKERVSRPAKNQERKREYEEKSGKSSGKRHQSDSVRQYHFEQKQQKDRDRERGMTFDGWTYVPCAIHTPPEYEKGHCRNPHQLEWRKFENKWVQACTHTTRCQFTVTGVSGRPKPTEYGRRILNQQNWEYNGNWERRCRDVEFPSTKWGKPQWKHFDGTDAPRPSSRS